MRHLHPIGFVLLTLSLGCSATLKTTAVTNSKEFKGIRVRSPVSFIVTKEVKTEKCRPRKADEIVHLALGDAYDIDFTPGYFSNDQFSISFGDSGVLKQVSLNTDPQFDEALTAAAALVEKVVGAAALDAPPACGAVLSDSIVAIRRLVIPE